MTLHISAASIHGLVAVCAVAGSAVNYNYSPLRGDSAADSNLEGHSWNPQCAAVILLMLNQAEWTGRRPNNSVLKKKKKKKKPLRLIFEASKWTVLQCRACILISLWTGPHAKWTGSLKALLSKRFYGQSIHIHPFTHWGQRSSYAVYLLNPYFQPVTQGSLGFGIMPKDASVCELEAGTELPTSW